MNESCETASYQKRTFLTTALERVEYLIFFCFSFSSLHYSILLSFFSFSYSWVCDVSQICSKKFQSRKKVHILWVGLFFSSHSLRKFSFLGSNTIWADLVTQSVWSIYYKNNCFSQYQGIKTKSAEKSFFSLLVFMMLQWKFYLVRTCSTVRKLPKRN